MSLSPFVYWGQTESTLSLRVDLKRTVNPVIELTEKKLSFSGEGYGARGQNQYLFHIEFFAEVEASDSFYKVVDRDIEFVLKKKAKQIWPRLLEAQVKPAWLKVDFDKMHDDDSDGHDVNDESTDWRRTPNLMRNLTHKFQDRDKDFGRKRKQSLEPEEFRKVYLFLYNMFQCVGHSYVLLVLAVVFSLPESEREHAATYDAISRPLKCLYLLRLLEVVHPLLGYTTGDFMYPAVESVYHLFLLFFVIDCEPAVQSRPVTFHLIGIWSMTQVIRHGYYMMRIFEVDTYLTWIHYSLWIILYPMSFFCEGILILVSIPLFDHSNRLSFHLPQFFNLRFSMAFVLRSFLLLFFIPIFCMKVTRMYKKRKYRLQKVKSDGRRTGLKSD